MSGFYNNLVGGNIEVGGSNNPLNVCDIPISNLTEYIDEINKMVENNNLTIEYLSKVENEFRLRLKCEIDDTERKICDESIKNIEKLKLYVLQNNYKPCGIILEEINGAHNLLEDRLKNGTLTIDNLQSSITYIRNRATKCKLDEESSQRYIAFILKWEEKLKTLKNETQQSNYRQKLSNVYQTSTKFAEKHKTELISVVAVGGIIGCSGVTIVILSIILIICIIIIINKRSAKKKIKIKAN
jgi:hypothetical protein